MDVVRLPERLSARLPGRLGEPDRPVIPLVRLHGVITPMAGPGPRSVINSVTTEKVLERVRRIATGGANDELAQLTAQEQKILLLVAEGKTNKEIAADVFLSDKTVKNYVSSILSKLNLQRRAQAAAYVAKHHGGA